MMKIGSLFTGYGGLDLAVEQVFGAHTVWTSEHDPATAPDKHGPNRVIATRFPDAPNLGDITRIDWTAVEPVDVLTGGFPCQDVSAAGHRAGLRPGTRTGLWSHMAYAIERLRPQYVVAENVRGLLSADAHSNVEPCPICLGNRPDSHLRALGAVLADLADLGYDAQWCGLRAADVGAPHGRYRIFILATDTRRIPGQPRSVPRPRKTPSRGPLGGAAGRDRAPVTLLPTPTARDHKGHPNDTARDRTNGLTLDVAAHLLPTPRATDGTKGGPNQRGSSGDLMLPSAVHLLPTPLVGGNSPTAHGQVSGQWRADMAEALTRWGDFAPAIACWEAVVARAAPAPTMNGRLSPVFVEWMMGLPPGWVTAVPGLTRPQELRLLGNGVVPQQAFAALGDLAGVAA